MDAVVLFFMLGVAAGLAKSDLKLPAALYDALSIYLLLAIGLKGGMELARQPFLAVAPQAVLAMSLGLVIPLIAFPVLRVQPGALAIVTRADGHRARRADTRRAPAARLRTFGCACRAGEAVGGAAMVRIRPGAAI